MVEATIKTIMETERQAEDMLREAEAVCREILEGAEREADALKAKAEADAKAEANSRMEAAIEAGKKSGDAARSAVADEIDQLKTAAKVKEAEAIASVIASLI